MSLHRISVVEFVHSRKRLQAKGKPAVKPLALAFGIVSAAVLGGIAPADAQKGATSLLDIYSDESHCLVSPEIRSDKDNPVSCFCRDAIADARYIYFNYFSASAPHGGDPNMAGIVLALQNYAGQMCSPNSEALNPDFIGKIGTGTTEKDWKWDGPEVVRTYPPDEVIQQIKPDKRGWISVEYTAVLLWRDSQGRVTKTENLSAVERRPAKDMLSKPQSPERPADRVPASTSKPR